MRWLILLWVMNAGAAQPTESLEQAQQDTPLEHAHKHNNPKYVCPMHPQIVRDAPGTCPICGMTLVEKKVDNAGDDTPIVQISPATQQIMNVRTAKVERGTLWKYIKTMGIVNYDDHQTVHIHPRAGGWVEKLRVRAEGDTVKQGEVLLDLYSPDMLSAQVDYLVAIKQGDALPKDRLHRARSRLKLLDIPDNIISQIGRKNEPQHTIPLISPQNGVVTKLTIREGMYVTPDTEIFSITDPSKMWIIAEVFETQQAWVKKGQAAEVRIAAYPDKKWEAEVNYIYPELDPKTRTLKVRLVLANPDLLLKPNQLTQIAILGGAHKALLKIPREALISTGERETVIKSLGNGRFQPVKVKTGIQQSHEIEILEGLTEGEEIVVSGQFLIDSESSLQASFNRLNK
ncbi:MAG: hypothetical protein RIT27_1570 [Pseudomonadota bacterium]